MENINLSTLFIVIGALMGVTNVVVQVFKKVTWDKLPTNILVVMVAELLTLGSGAAYAQIEDVQILWYHVAAAVVVGLFVAYAAMFGFDKLKEALNWGGKDE